MVGAGDISLVQSARRRTFDSSTASHSIAITHQLSNRALMNIDYYINLVMHT